MLEALQAPIFYSALHDGSWALTFDLVFSWHRVWCLLVYFPFYMDIFDQGGGATAVFDLPTSPVPRNNTLKNIEHQGGRENFTTCQGWHGSVEAKWIQENIEKLVRRWETGIWPT